MKSIKISIFTKLLISAITGMTIFCTSGFATHIAKDNAYLVHATDFFPTDGDMIAGSIPQFPQDIQKENRFDDVKDRLIIGQFIIPQIRITLHWCLNSFVASHPHPNQKITMEINREQYLYVIIEPLKNFGDSVISGYWQDVATIGGHRLSPDSVILVRDDDVSYKDKIGKFQGQIVKCKKNFPDEVNDWLEKMQAPVLKTDTRKSSDPLVYLSKEAEVTETYDSKEKQVTSKEISSAIGLDNTLFGKTDLGILEVRVRYFFCVVREFEVYYQLSKLRKRDYSKIIKEKLDDGYNFIISKNLSLGTYLFVNEWKTPKEELSFIMKKIDDLMREYRNNNIIVDNLTHWKKFITTWTSELYTYSKNKKYTAEDFATLVNKTLAKIEKDGCGRMVSHPPEAIKEKVTSYTEYKSKEGKVKSCAYCFIKLEKPLICSRCKDVFYCSPACQKNHWPVHKTYCEQSKE